MTIGDCLQYLLSQWPLILIFSFMWIPLVGIVKGLEWIFKKKRSIIPILLFIPFISEAQISIDNSIPVDQLVQDVLLGQGISATNVIFNGQPGNQVFLQASSFDGSLSNIGVPLGQQGIISGVILSSGETSIAFGPNNQTGSTVPAGGLWTPGDIDLDAIGSSTHDAAVLEFDFVPTGDTVKFRYVFASEEYLEFVNSGYNDVFGFFLSGPSINGPYSNNSENIALIPFSTQAVNINNVNDVMNPQYYVINGDGFTAPWNTDVQCNQFDGMTVILEAKSFVECGQTYHIKIAIADAGDAILDSGVFLEAGSFVSTDHVVPTLSLGGVSANDTTMFEGCGLVPFFFHRYGDTTNTDTIDISVSGTSTAGIDYYPSIPSQLIYYPGDTAIDYPLTIPLDPDGIETIIISITQDIVCSNTQVVNTYTFYIDQYDPISIETNDINGDCGEDYVLSPIVSGGTTDKTILWNTGDITWNILVSPGVTTTYYFMVSDTCGVTSVNDSITVNIPVYPQMVISTTPDTLIDCLGNGDLQVYSVSGGNDPYTYVWILNGSEIGSSESINVTSEANDYVIEVTDECGSIVSDTIHVGMVPLSLILITTTDQNAICIGDEVVLSVDGVEGGNGVYSYQWTNSQNQVLGNSDTLSVVVDYDAMYTVSVSDQCGYQSDTLVGALIPDRENFQLDLTKDTTICLGDTISLLARVSGGSGYYTIDWVGHNCSDPYLTISPESNTNYRVEIYDQCGENISDDVLIGVENPEVDIVATNIGQDDWLFEAATLPTFARNYRWGVDDGFTSRDKSFHHSFLDLEEHWIHLSIVTFVGCKGVDSLMIVPPGQLFFPNAFTPDGDGINEFFGPGQRYIDQFELLIFDRWGEVVYQTNRIDKPWDGTVNGFEAPSGVYVYKVTASGHLFAPVERYGHVTLLRGSN